MPRRRFAIVTLATLALALTLPAGVGRAQEDPFAVLSRHRGGSAVPVPPRALAVIPERHTGRLLRMVDVLVAVDPQFDEVATAAGFDGRRAIQIRTREARVPVFLAKDDGTIATLLQIPIGARVEIRGVLVAAGSRYLLVASEVRQTTGASRPPQ